MTGQITILILFIVLIAFMIYTTSAINTLSYNFDLFVKHHNALCDVVKDICDSLNAAGIPAPKTETINKSEKK